MPTPANAQGQITKKAVYLHFSAPTSAIEANDIENAAALELRDQILRLRTVDECCRSQDRGRIGMTFHVSDGAESYDQLLSSVFLELADAVQNNELLLRPGAVWRATYENGSLADEGSFGAAELDDAGRGA